MPVIFRKYLSLFLLTVFLFPCVEKEVHRADHEGEKHCTEKPTAHFHESHHQCTICDFSLTGLFNVIYFNSVFEFIPFSYLSQFSFSEAIISASAFSLSLRGPPAFS